MLFRSKDKSLKIPVEQTGISVQFTLPSKAVDHPLTVLVVETEGLPEVEPQSVLAGEKGSYDFTYLHAITHGNAVTRFNRKGGFHISKWEGPEDYVEWIADITKPGKFRLNIFYSANREWEGKAYEIFINSERFEKDVISTGDWFEFQEFPVGYIELPETGKISIKIRPKSASDSNLMYLRSLTLIPVDNVKQAGWGTSN